MSTGTATTVVDDNSELTTALQSALAADENAIAIAGQTASAIKAANNEIETAQGRLADANEAAETAWDDAYEKLKARAKRSPVGAGPFGALTVAIVALGLTLFAGCGASSKQVSDLSSRFTAYEDVMGEVFRESQKESAELTKVLEAHSAAIDRQTAAISKALNNPALAQQLPIIQSEIAKVDRELTGLGTELESRMGDRFAAVSRRIDGLEVREPCSCGEFVPAPCPDCVSRRLGNPPPEVLILPQQPPRNPATESDSPAPSELAPAAKKPKPKLKACR